MPRYFFHLYNDEILHDDVGQDFAGAGAARAGALLGISELIAEHLAQNKSVELSHRIEIADHCGAIVDRIVFGDLFTCRGAPLRLPDR